MACNDRVAAGDESPDPSIKNVVLPRSQTEPLVLSVPALDSVCVGDIEKFRHWYPDWNTWKFRRTLAYWISILYCEGSLLFTVGAAFSLSPLHNQSVMRALVDVPYFVGGICFTLGGYAGVLELINVRNPDIMTAIITRHQWRELLQVTRWQQRIGSLAYLLGALAFNLNTIGSFVASGPWQEQLLIWVPGALGSLGFVAGASCECFLNDIAHFSPHASSHWLSVMNLLGSMLFLLAATSGSIDLAGSISLAPLVDLLYFLGSVSFGVGSLFGLWMWKCEQYGLAMIPQINLGLRMSEPDSHVISMHAQYGCGRSSASQLPWLFLYMINASASVADVGLATRKHLWNQESDIHRVIEGFLNFALSHGILMLGSVVHHVPTAAPHSWLLKYMRCVMLLYTANSCYNIYLLAGALDSCIEPACS